MDYSYDHSVPLPDPQGALRHTPVRGSRRQVETIVPAVTDPTAASYGIGLPELVAAMATAAAGLDEVAVRFAADISCEDSYEGHTTELYGLDLIVTGWRSLTTEEAALVEDHLAAEAARAEAEREHQRFLIRQASRAQRPTGRIFRS